MQIIKIYFVNLHKNIFMQKIENQFVNLIKSKNSKNISFIEEVAQALETNYDAAYRRVNGRTTISLEDAVKLAKYFKVSLDKLFLVGDSSKILVHKTIPINSVRTLEKYFDNVQKNLKPVENNNKAIMFYAAKELPVFHILQNEELLRFKIYVWMQVLGSDKQHNESLRNKPQLPRREREDGQGT